MPVATPAKSRGAPKNAGAIVTQAKQNAQRAAAKKPVAAKGSGTIKTPAKTAATTGATGSATPKLTIALAKPHYPALAASWETKIKGGKGSMVLRDMAELGPVLGYDIYSLMSAECRETLTGRITGPQKKYLYGLIEHWAEAPAAAA